MAKDLILAADHLITMDADNRIFEDGAVLVRGDRIAAVGPRAEIEKANPAAELRRLRNRVLIPGLINAHLHSGILRGTAEGLPVWDWLRMYIDPMHRVLQPRDAEVASWLCYAEAVLSGTTTVVDMWRYMDGSARAAKTIGNRAVLVPYVGEHPDYNYFENFDKNEALLETWHGKADGRINVWVGLEHLFYTDEAGYRRAIELAKKFDTGFHTHSNEAEIELAEMHRRYGLRPIQALERLGLFEPRKVLLAHCVWLDDLEIRILAERGVGVAHNPVSNMKLASGTAPVEKLLKAGVSVGIGTDGEKENNNLDMFDDMKCASLLAKLHRLDAAALDAWEVLRMATIHGARCIGLENEIGSLVPGKKADMIAVRTDTPRMTPLMGGAYFNLHHNLVHAVRGSDVDMTMVDGNIVVEGGRLLTADLQDLIADVHAVVPGLFERRAEYLEQHRNGAVSPV
jgi:5-methylthioadenosine/S-adenosylhomocysteine deaminase